MISHLDHFVLTTRDMQGCVDFYSGLLGMVVVRFGTGRTALRFGQQKINIHGYQVPKSICGCIVLYRPSARVRKVRS